MRVLFVTNEAVPFAKVGGLADVAGSLPRAIAREGVDIRIAMPHHRQCPPDERCEVTLPGLSVQAPTRAFAAGVLETTLPDSNVPVYFVKYDPYFDRPEVYGPSGGEYADSAERFAFFARSALALNHAIGFDADIIHANDWPTGLIPAFQKLNPLGSPTVFTIHNLAYQGSFLPDDASEIDIDPASEAMRLVAREGRINYMAAAIRSATVINTVSERYAREIQTTILGEALDDLLSERADDLYGILNGIDYDEWSPQDQSLPAPYSADDLSGKARCKAALQEALGLPVEPQVPLVLTVSRLVHQKGLDVLAEVLPAALKLPIQFALLGTGDPTIERRYRALAQANPETVAAVIDYDDPMARLFYAGGDMFVMPSRYEPCGLSQMIAMARGTVPIAHATGGLADTISETGERQTGFLFRYLTEADLLGAIRRAVSAYHLPSAWRRIVRTAMAEDFSWDASAREYVRLYETALAGRRNSTAAPK